MCRRCGAYVVGSGPGLLVGRPVIPLAGADRMAPLPRESHPCGNGSMTFPSLVRLTCPPRTRPVFRETLLRSGVLPNFGPLIMRVSESASALDKAAPARY